MSLSISNKDFDLSIFKQSSLYYNNELFHHILRYYSIPLATTFTWILSTTIVSTLAHFALVI